MDGKKWRKSKTLPVSSLIGRKKPSWRGKVLFATMVVESFKPGQGEDLMRIAGRVSKFVFQKRKQLETIKHQSHR